LNAESIDLVEETVGMLSQNDIIDDGAQELMPMVACTTFHANLEDGPEYEALS
jgi:hypothetical protein